MRLHIIYTISLLLSTASLYSQTNAWTGGGGDNQWTNPLNWSLGHTPTPTESVEIGGIYSVTIPTGSNISIYELQSSADPFTIQSGATLNIEYFFNHLSGGKLINNGQINITYANNLGVNLYGTLINNGDIDLLNSSTYGIIVKEAQLINNGTIDIINSASVAIFSGNVPIVGYSRKITNNIGGLINIGDIEDDAIWLNDTLINHGSIIINDVNRHVTNVPAQGIYIDEDGNLENHGSLIITDVDDDGITNHNRITNMAGGEILISTFDRYGIYNDAFWYNYGYLEISGSISSDGDPGIYLDNRFDNESGGEVVIDGNYFIDDGVDCNLGTFYNKAGASLEVKQVTVYGLRVDGGNFDNDGTIIISDITEQFAYGIECLTNFWNDGAITMDDIKGGIRAAGFSFENNGSITMTNMQGTCLKTEDEFHNMANGSIEISGVPGETIVAGISSLDDALGYNPFINDGTIEISHAAIAIDQRDGTFENNGSISISDSDFGINQWGFFDPPIFENAGSIDIRDLSFGTYAIHVEEGDANSFNFSNLSTGTIYIENTYGGIDATSGVENHGSITMKNISERAIYINGVGISAEFSNGVTGMISIDNALNGIYFDGTLLGEINNMPFNNDGIVTLNNVSGELITGDDSNEKFNNSNTVFLDGHLDCTWMDLDAIVGVGDSIGKLDISNYAAINPEFTFDLTGNGVNKNFNNHDTITFDAAVTIGGDLIVTSLPGFVPAIGEEYTLLQSTVSLLGSFTNSTLPNLPSNMEWSLNYLSDRITLSILSNKKEWLGTINPNWNNAGNWEGGTVPSVIDDVLIPSGAINNPQVNIGVFTIGFSNMNTTHECNSMEIEEGANLIINSNAVIRNRGELIINGLLRLKNTTLPLINNNGGSIEIGPLGGLIIKP